MRPFLCAVLTAGLSMSSAADAEQAVSAAELAAKGAAAAEASFPGYANLCNLDARMRNVNVPRTARSGSGGQNGSQARSSEGQRSQGASGNRTAGGRPGASPIDPVQVFDNLYFLGTGSVSAYLYGTDEGYILIDGLNTDEEAETYIFGGMKTLGLDPTAIKHILVTHGHGDHYGGADYVAEKLGLEVTMSEADWALVKTLGVHPRFGPPPQQGITVEDGEVLTAGASSLTVHLTPGHTPGTISPVFALSNQGLSHKGMIWGGTGFNFGPNVGIFKTYAQSAQKMREVATAENIDVYLSNHVARDGSGDLLRQISAGRSDAVTQLVRGKDGLALFEVLENCALAQAARFEQAQ